MSSKLQQLGRAVAGAQDEALTRSEPRALDLRFADAPARNSSMRLVWTVGVALTALLLGVGGWVMGSHEAESVGFRVGRELALHHDLKWLQAPEDQPLHVHFSDGSEVHLSARGRMRVVKLDARGAGLQLESGQLELAVRHRAQTHWNVDAGPFGVRVVGTRFGVAWEPTRGELTLRLTEGAVELTGPVINKRRVVKGELIRVSLHEQQANVQLSPTPLKVTSTPLAQPTPNQRAAPIAEAVEAKAVHGQRRHARARTSTRAEQSPEQPPNPPSFEELARAGRYAEALQRVAGAAWQPTLESASASSLILLGDAARLTGKLPQAEEVYRRIRARFAGSREAASSAFALGRIFYDQRHQPRQAASWFSTYLREAPSGSLACEAEARLMEAQQSSGELSEARDSAASYLRRCPTGPHVPLARNLLGSAAP